MTTQNLVRWSGLAVIAAGVLGALFAVLDFLLFPPSQPLIQVSTMPFSQQVATNAWLIEQVVNWVNHVLLLWALVGLYSHQAHRAGVLGFVGFLVSFLGLTLLFGTIWGFWILAPGLAKAAPDILDSTVTQFSVLPGLIGLVIPFVLALLGLLLFGLASLRAKVFPRWAVVLFTVGPLLHLVKGFIGLPFLPDTVFGAGLMWMGYALWSEKSQEAVQPAPGPSGWEKLSSAEK